MSTLGVDIRKLDGVIISTPGGDFPTPGMDVHPIVFLIPDRTCHAEDPSWPLPPPSLLRLSDSCLTALIKSEVKVKNHKEKTYQSLSCTSPGSESSLPPSSPVSSRIEGDDQSDHEHENLFTSVFYSLAGDYTAI